MSQCDPLYGVGARVMVRHADRITKKFDHGNTVVMARAWRDVAIAIDAATDEIVSCNDGWYYEVAAHPGFSIAERHIHPRPEPGASWEQIKRAIGVSPVVTA